MLVNFRLENKSVVFCVYFYIDLTIIVGIDIIHVSMCMPKLKIKLLIRMLLKYVVIYTNLANSTFYSGIDNRKLSCLFPCD